MHRPAFSLGSVALAAIVLAQVVALTAMLRGNQELIVDLQQVDGVIGQRSFFQRMLENDPTVGHRLPVPSTADLRGDGLAGSSAPTVLVFASSCSQCYKSDLLQWQQVQQAQRDLRVILVSRDDPDAQKSWREDQELLLPVVFDREDALHQAYNAGWALRTYLVDADGRLVWMQKSVGSRPWEEVVRLIGEEERT